MITVRKAYKTEIDWVNTKYNEINFMESSFDDEFIVIAEYNNEECGIGRLIKIDEHNLELGGIYVFNEYRGFNIAQEIILYLLEKNSYQQKNIWCLPFKSIAKFYKRFGFTENTKSNLEIPKKIINKLNWCNSSYENEVTLMFRTKNNN